MSLSDAQRNELRAEVQSGVQARIRRAGRQRAGRRTQAARKQAARDYGLTRRHAQKLARQDADHSGWTSNPISREHQASTTGSGAGIVADQQAPAT